MKIIFVVLGLVLFLNQLFIKHNIWLWIQKKGAGSRYEFIFKMTSCQFCMMFHLSWILTIVYAVFSSFTWFCVIVPFVVTGLTSTIIGFKK